MDRFRCTVLGSKGVSNDEACTEVHEIRAQPQRQDAGLRERPENVLVEQSKFFERNGYAVQSVLGRAPAEQALLNHTYEIVVLGHTLSKDDRHHLAYKAKRSNSDTQVLVLHASGKHPAVDLAIDSRYGEQTVLAALESLAKERMLVAC